MHSVYEDEDNYWLAMELIEGGELFEHLIHSGAYSEAKAAVFLRQFAEALSFVHDCGGEGQERSHSVAHLSVLSLFCQLFMEVSAPTDSMDLSTFRWYDLIQTRSEAREPASLIVE